MILPGATAVRKAIHSVMKAKRRCARKRFSEFRTAELAAYAMSVRIQKLVKPIFCERCNGYHLRAK